MTLDFLARKTLDLVQDPSLKRMAQRAIVGAQALSGDVAGDQVPPIFWEHRIRPRRRAPSLKLN